MLLDFKNQVLGIPEKKRSTCLQLLQHMILAYEKHQQVTVKKKKKLAGHLNFICQAIPAGKTFMSGLYTLSISQG